MERMYPIGEKAMAMEIDQVAGPSTATARAAIQTHPVMAVAKTATIDKVALHKGKTTIRLRHLSSNKLNQY